MHAHSDAYAGTVVMTTLQIVISFSLMTSVPLTRWPTQDLT